MMLSTHVAYGFVFAFVLILVLANLFPENFAILLSSSGVFAILGAIGGIIPDLDRIEQTGMIHRRTLHYAVGWGLATLLLIGIWLLL